MAKTYLTAVTKYPIKFDSVEGASVYPYVLTTNFLDLVIDRDILVQGSTSIGLFINIEPGSNFKMKLLGTHDSTTYYSLPIVGFSNPEAVVLKPYIVEFNATVDDNNYVFSIPVSDVIRYARIQVAGTGQLNGLEVVVK